MIPYGVMYNLHRFNIANRERVRQERARRFAGWTLLAVLVGVLAMVLR